MGRAGEARLDALSVAGLQVLGCSERVSDWTTVLAHPCEHVTGLATFNDYIDMALSGESRGTAVAIWASSDFIAIAI